MQRSLSELDPKQFLMEHMRHPNPVLVYGYGLGIGKTDFALWLASKCIDWKLHHYVITNIKITDDAGYPVRIVRNSRELERTLERIKRTKIIVFDEAGIIVSSRRSLSAENMYMFRLVRLARKHRAKLLFVTQAYEDIDSAIRRMLIMEAQKLSKKAVVLRSYDYRYYDNEVTINNLPSSPIKFDTYDTADFKIYDLEQELAEEVLKRLQSISYLDRKILDYAIECEGSLECIERKSGIGRNNVVKKIAKVLKRVLDVYEIMEQVEE